MARSTHEQVITFGRDTTIHWPCRQGDFILWLQFPGMFAKEPNMADFWEMREGDFVTITNRGDDLPAWFELHPSEAQGALAYALMARIKAGWQPPDASTEGSNLWCLKAGDRLAWVGDSRPGQEAINGVLAILDCKECALGIGETNRTDIESALVFGALSTPDMSPADIQRCQVAVEAVRHLGPPRNWSPDWALG